VLIERLQGAQANLGAIDSVSEDEEVDSAETVLDLMGRGSHDAVATNFIVELSHLVTLNLTQ
jgi:hypothetical protein